MNLNLSFPSGSRLLVGVSGGLDSVALLHLLAEQMAGEGWVLGVGHVNHGIRGAAAHADEEFVCALGKTLGIPVHVHRADVPSHAAQRGISVEMSAREVRKAAFTGWMKRFKYDALLLAHTLDDQAETVLLRLVRGTGLTGLAAMARESQWAGDRVIRPLLDTTKEALKSAMLERGVEWREDESNKDSDFLRNRVRHELLPLLSERFNPKIRLALVRLSELVREEDALLNQMALEDTEKCLKPLNPSSLDVSMLNQLVIPRRRRVVMNWLFAQGIDPEEVQFDLVERVIQLCACTDGFAQLDLRNGKSIERAYDTLEIKDKGSVSTVSKKCKLAVPGVTEIPSLGLQVVTRRGRGFRKNQQKKRCGDWPDEVFIDSDWLGRAALYVRTWREGDRIVPMGMKGHRKISDIFIDQKVPRNERERIPLLEARGEVIWIPGYRLAAPAAVTGAITKSIHVEFRSALPV